MFVNPEIVCYDCSAIFARFKLNSCLAVTIFLLTRHYLFRFFLLTRHYLSRFFCWPYTICYEFSADQTTSVTIFLLTRHYLSRFFCWPDTICHDFLLTKHYVKIGIRRSSVKVVLQVLWIYHGSSEQTVDCFQNGR